MPATHSQIDPPNTNPWAVSQVVQVAESVHAEQPTIAMLHVMQLELSELSTRSLEQDWQLELEKQEVQLLMDEEHSVQLTPLR